MTVAGILADPAFEELKAYVLAHTGLHYYADKDEDLATRLGRRFVVRGVSACARYLHLLSSDAAGQEHDALAGELTIGETYFFRQEEHFALLRDTVVPQLLERNAAARQLSIWSAGCATGAEPYSVSLLLQSHFASQLKGWNVDILGTDINPDFLAQARAARFGKWALRDLGDDVKARCFDKDGKHWRLRPVFRSGVRFAQLNLVGPEPYPGPFDVIFCRNVLIYFSAETIRAVAARLYHSLAPGGWLLVGHAEPSALAFHQFELFCENGVTAYRRNGIGKAATVVLPALPAPVAPLPSRVKARETTAKPIVPAAPEPACPTAAVLATEDIRMLADRGFWAEAEDECRRMLEAEPLSAAAHYTLGLILAHAGDRVQAEAEFRRAIYLDRGFALAHYHAGAALERVNANKARKSYENVLGLLEGATADDQVPEGDGMTVDELRELARMHLSLLSSNRG